MPLTEVVGAPIPRVEGPDKVTGRAKYAADVQLPGAIWGKCLHSTVSHGLIKRIDTSKARALPGVHAVITGADTRDGGLWGRLVKDAPVLAFDRVRYYGERVAAVAADDEDICQDALSLIEVEYEELPAVLDPREALEDGVPIIHPDFNSYVGFRQKHDKPSNVHAEMHFEKGDVERGFADSDLVVENTYVTNRQSQAPMEPHALLVHIDASDGRIHLWHCNKKPHDVRGALAHAAGVPEERIVIHPTYIGGDFGAKGNSRITPICYYLAKASGRPVRMISDYVEEFTAGNPRHEVLIKLKTGVKRDGTLVAHTVDHIVNSGAFAAFKPYGMISGANEAAGPYRVPNCRIDSRFVYTNNIPGGFMRAPGEPQGAFALESQLDEVARELGMDPAEFRLKNLIRDGDETAFGHHLEHVRAVETLEAALEASGYRAPKPANVGRGVAFGERGTGAGEGNVEIRLEPDGAAIVGTPMFDQGTGTYTTIAQTAGQELGIAPGEFRLEVWDTDQVPSDSGLAGSRGTHVNTVATFEAAQHVKRELIELAARHLGWPAGEVTFEGGQLRHGSERIGWQELLARLERSVSARVHTEAPRSHMTSFVAQVAEVSVDPDTGEIKLLRFTTAHDTGTVLNPIGYQGQVNGALQHGLGMSLMEEIVVENGRSVTAHFGDYKMPTIADMPPLQTVVLPSEHGDGPYNVRGIGEAGCVPTPAAIANAVDDAIGARIRKLPVTAEKVYQALHAH